MLTKAKLCYMGTDSLIAYIKRKGIYKYIPNDHYLEEKMEKLLN